MRFRSDWIDGYRVFAVAGTNTVCFAIEADVTKTGGLLGFAIERHDPAKNERYFMPGFKVFPSVYPHPTDGLTVSTFDQPVQSFVWDDFTAEAGHSYVYEFHPLRGEPKNLDRSAAPIPIEVTTEPLYTDDDHDVFFNRGVLSSQAYAHKFGNVLPDAITDEDERQRAFDWLARDLDKAVLRFVDRTGPGDRLLCCFYEFGWKPIADALIAAIGRGVDVQLIVDAKDNAVAARPASAEHPKPRKAQEAFPRTGNLDLLQRQTSFPMDRVVLREANPNDIQHNKFMVWLTGHPATPAEVWTGSTNMSKGGIFGQANVGHWVRDPAAAAHYREYWKLLATDPGTRKGDDRAISRSKMAAYRKSVEKLVPVPTGKTDIPAGVSTVFSPRSGSAVLDLYAALNDEAEQLSCVTFAFSIAEPFKTRLADNTGDSHLAFLMLERRDAPAPRSDPQRFIALDWRNNVYEAFGSWLRQPLHQWARETWTKAGIPKHRLNTNVMFVHCKFLLVDPLGPDPIVITGSANFSAASTNDNDENMVIIRGNRRVADIYLTEFNRLFNHYYFRSVTQLVSEQHMSAAEAHRRELESLFLYEKAEGWLSKYRPGSLKAKRVAAITQMTL